MTEIWKDIKEFEGYYQISNNGSVRSLDRTINCNTGTKQIKGIALKPIKNTHGYYHVSLKNARLQITAKLHRLVAKYFLEPDPDRPEVNHRDGDKANNKVSNLEWCTRTENEAHAYELGLKKVKEERINSKLSNEDALFIQKNYGVLTAKQLAIQFEVSESTIWHCAKGRTWK